MFCLTRFKALNMLFRSTICSINCDVSGIELLGFNAQFDILTTALSDSVRYSPRERGTSQLQEDAPCRAHIKKAGSKEPA